MEIDYKHLETVDSTVRWVESNLESLDRNKLTIVTANTMTDGVCRHANRRWIAPPKVNIYLTACLFIPALRPDLPNTAQVMAISVANVLETLGFSPSIRWPNDVLLSDKKVSGVLARITSHGDSYALSISAGVNVNMTPEQLAEIDKPATSLQVEKGESFNRDTVRDALILEFSQNLQCFLDNGFKLQFERLSTLVHAKEGTPLQLNDYQKIWNGKFHSLNSDGSLNLELPLNDIRTFLAGEILEEETVFSKSAEIDD
ncbi:hypothetical protein SCG7086_AC_00320 [Chlamydiales bacterium SCGC AG-110-P3]|nr:hypothetical protein SCG7086_AC_00320 [Chlamydiales bacterium SCGC AG-110-P3]